MKNLKEYMKIKDKVERLEEFINDNGQWQEEYIDDCPDFKDAYDYILFESEIYKGELEQDTIDAIEVLESKNNVDLIYEHTTIEITYGFHCVSGEIASMNIGEVETQLSGLSDNEGCTCIFTELIKDMTKEEIQEASSNTDYYLSGDCIYINRDYDRVSLILNEEEFLKEYNS